GSHAPALRLDRRDAPGPHRRVQRCRRDRQIPTASLYADLDRLGADAARAAIRGLTRPARPEVAAGQFRSCPENAGLGVGQSAPQRLSFFGAVARFSRLWTGAGAADLYAGNSNGRPVAAAVPG